jgi:hypothetical protein
MTRFDLSRNPIAAQEPLIWAQRDASLGQNSRQNALVLAENQSEELYNIDISTPGKRQMRKGSVLIGDDVGNADVVALFSADTKLVMVEGVNVRLWTGTGNWGSPIYTSVSGEDVGIAYGKESGVAPDDIIIFQDGVNNAQRALLDGTIQDLGDTNTSPPKTTVMTWYGNRFWTLLNDQLCFSDAYDSDYSDSFDRSTNYYRTTVGPERALSYTRDLGMIIGGKNGIQVFAPSAVPAATDQIQSLLPEYGIVSKKGWCVGGDDWYFFSHDGLRALKRTVQDKLQLGTSYPLSYQLKTEFDAVNWARIDELSMVEFDNKIICSVPTGVSSYMTWVYYPSLQSMTVWNGYNARCWAKYQVSGEERLYYGKQGNGVVYRALYGSTDEGTTITNGTAITLREITKKIDFGNILQKKEGHTFEIKGDSVGDYDVTCYVQFDDGPWQTLGVFNPIGNSITFPVTFPVTMYDTSEVREKFHLRRFGKFNYCQFKYEMTAAYTDSSPLTITETNALAIADPYMEE